MGWVGFKALLLLANFTLGPHATLNTEIHKNSVRIKAPNTVNASKRKHKNQINHYNKQKRVLMANSTVCQSKWQVTPIFPTKFRVNWPFSSAEVVQNRLSRWRAWWPSWISDRTSLATSDLLDTPVPQTKFQVNLFNGSGGVVDIVKSLRTNDG